MHWDIKSCFSVAWDGKKMLFLPFPKMYKKLIIIRIHHNIYNLLSHVKGAIGKVGLSNTK